MKKILAILLAVTMVLGMGATGFAWWDDTATFTGRSSVSGNIVAGDDTNKVTFSLNAATGTIAGNTPPSISNPDGSQTLEFTDDDFTTVNDVYADLTEANAIKVTDVSMNRNTITVKYDINSKANMTKGDVILGDLTLTLPVEFTKVDGTTVVDSTFVYTISFNATYATVTTTTVDGNDAADITRFADNKGIAEEVKMTIAGGTVNPVRVESIDGEGDYARVDTGKLRPIDEPDIRFYLRADMFDGDDYTPEVGDVYLGQTAVRENRMSARIQTAKGSSLIKAGPTIKYNGGKAYVDLDFLDELTSVDDEGFEFTIALSIDGKRMDRNGEAAIVVGSLENIHERVYADDEDFYLDEQDVIIAEDFNDDIELYLGAGVSVFTKLYKGKEYYGIAKRNDDEADDVVMAAHPDIDNVVRLYTVGLNSTGDVVGFSTDYDNYYVYDEDLNLLGMSDERVEFRSVYYLANRPLDVDVDVEPIDPPDDGEFAPPAGTGGDMAPTNANANPGTGF